jgi:ureidoglycolate amidohydrolase
MDPEGERLLRELDELAAFSSAPAPAVTRVVYSPEDMAARAYVKGLMAEAGLEIREDALGNTFARWPGSDPGLPPVATGSHIDAIPNAGRYDGTVGVLGALAAIRALQASGFTPRRGLELILFTSEEPTRFGVGCLGSRAMSGALTPDALAVLTDEDGVTLEQARRRAGFTGDLGGVGLPQGAYHAFLELHIEQGPLLDAGGYDIGAVTAIAAPAALHVTLTGEGGHAGAVLMPERRDALLAAAEVALAVERAALDTGASDSVATVGILDVQPRAVNSIPSRAYFTVDARDTDLARRDRMVARIQQAVVAIAETRRVEARVATISTDPPATCAPAIVRTTEEATRALGLACLPLVSRAYHDALFMARLAPTGMIFIPCRGGVSHSPDEYASPEAIQRGVRVLARVLAELAG